ncbi:hypothetical protein SCUCBS95973_002470 [Sporothrix curviconia]|uniref:Glycine-rich cell wall structural protein 1 n=1 Tax=Sporothrix curviconia TaxID=1260050 RepID=A0ABP0B7G3_9PEZI
METVSNLASKAAQAVWPSNQDGAARVDENGRTYDGSNTTSYAANNDSSLGGTGNTNNTSTIPTASSANVGPTTGTGTGASAGSSTLAPTDSSSEPLSGVLGNTSKGEPYDAGNKDEQDAAYARYSETRSPEAGAGAASGAGAGIGAGAAAGAGAGAGAAAAESKNTPETQQTKNAGGSDNPAATSEAAGAAGMKGSKVPSGGSADAGKNETNLDVPGPRPLQQVAAEHHGDAGKANFGEDGKGSGGSGGSGGTGAAGGNDEDDDKPQSASHGEGTGEKYVRSTGLNADGGDFDAAREGAGREADRILEQKGISHGADTNPGASSAVVDDSTSSSRNNNNNTGSPDKKEKVSLGEKIKNKLRRSS